MSFELSALGRLRVAIETGVSAFAVDQSASPSNFLDVPVIEGSVTPDRKEEKLDPNILQTMLDDFAVKVRGPRSCGLNFGMNLASTGTALDGTVAVPTTSNWAMHRLLTTIMGGCLQPSVPAALTKVVAAGSTASTVNVTATHGPNFTPGSAIGFTINGRIEAREILSISGDAISLKVALSATPANNSQVYYGQTFYLTENPANSLQFLHEGAETGDRFVYGGLQGGFDLDLSTGMLPKINYKLEGAYWSKLSTGSLAVGTVLNHSPAPILDSETLIATVGSTTRNVIHCSQEKWTPSVSYVNVNSSSVSNGSNVLRKHRARGRVLTGSFTMYEDSSEFDFFTADANKTPLALFKQCGSVAGNIVLLSAPTIQVMTPKRADAGGLQGREVMFEGRNDTAIDPYAGSYRSSALKIHVL